MSSFGTKKKELHTMLDLDTHATLTRMIKEGTVECYSHAIAMVTAEHKSRRKYTLSDEACAVLDRIVEGGHAVDYSSAILKMHSVYKLRKEATAEEIWKTIVSHSADRVLREIAAESGV